MKKILLAGNPNVGKSAVFNRLTGARVTISNYPGTTVDFTRGYMRIGGREFEIIDLPGAFSLEPKDKAEEVTRSMLEEEKANAVISVIDASSVERGLYLTLELIERGYPIVVALNMSDVARDKKVGIYIKKLEEILGVPVVETVATTGSGIKELVSKIPEAKSVSIKDIKQRAGGKKKSKKDSKDPLSVDERWKLIDKISKQVVLRGKYKHTLKDVISDLTVRPATGIPFAIAVLFGFWAFFGAFAGFFTDGIFVPLFDEHFLPAIQGAWPDPGSMHYWIFVGDPAATSCLEAFGVFTSGLFVAIGIVLPAIVAFYLILTILEDTGYMPRLAVLVDGLLHKIGLHGFAIVPTILSLGCNVPAVTASRVLETRKQRFMMMAMLAVFIPCGAQIGVMQELIPSYAGLIIIYLFFGYFVMGALLNKIIPGKSPEILIDVPPYRSPTTKNVGTKMWVRIKSFFKVAIPFVLLGCVVVNVLYWFGVIDWLGKIFEPLFVGWFGVPGVVAAPLVMAFLRKDMAVGTIGGLAAAGLLTTGQVITSVVLVSIYFPCLATFMMILKEGGVKNLLGSLAVMVGSFFIFGGLMRGIVALAGV